MWGFLVASRCIFILIMTLLDHRNTATTKKLDFKNSHLTSVGANLTLPKHPSSSNVQDKQQAQLRIVYVAQLRIVKKGPLDPLL